MPFPATHSDLTHSILVSITLARKLVALLRGLSGWLAALSTPMVVGFLGLSFALSLDTHHGLQLMMGRLAFIWSSLRVLCHGSLDA